jgi:hypothetical protein
MHRCTSPYAYGSKGKIKVLFTGKSAFEHARNRRVEVHVKLKLHMDQN